MKLKATLSAILILVCYIVHAQDWKRTSVWYFGDRAGLSFSTTPPSTLTNGAMYALEGCAVISDTNGNLLFYTNGQTVWNKDHQVMINGDGLLGDLSSSQAALIVPQPGNDNIFFIFTTGMNAPLYYNVVDISLDSGRGQLVEKNLFLVNTQTEKLAATYHNNGVDIWVVTHEYNTNNYYSFLITQNDIVQCPVISSVGSVMGPSVFTKQGEMKFSPSGNLLAISFFNLRFSELVQFNTEKGEFYNPIKISSGLTGPDYPISSEFSPSESKLYITERDHRLVQYAIDTLNEQIINTSRTEIYSSPLVRTLKLSFNQEILCGFENSSQIGVIEYPDSTGLSCSFIPNKYSVHPRVSTYNSSPNFVSSYSVIKPVDFGYLKNCKNDSFLFFAKNAIQTGEYNWKIFKNDTSLIDEIPGSRFNYYFNDTGIYSIKLYVKRDHLSDSISKSVSYLIKRENIFYSDTIVCADSLLLDAGLNYCYLWSDSSTDRYKNIKQSGEYSVKIVTNEFCILYDTIKVILDKHSVPISISRNGDTIFTFSVYKSYQWYKNGSPLIGETSSQLIIYEKGTYKLLGIDTGNCSGYSNEIVIDTLTSVLPFSIPNITIYPNPSVSNKEIHIKSDIPIERIELYTIDGKMLQKNGPLLENRIYLKHINPGTYLLIINHLYHYNIVIH